MTSNERRPWLPHHLGPLLIVSAALLATSVVVSEVADEQFQVFQNQLGDWLAVGEREETTPGELGVDREEDAEEGALREDGMGKRSLAFGRGNFRPAGKRSIAFGRMRFRPGKRSFTLGREGFRPGKRSYSLGRQGFRPGKRSLALGRTGFRPGKRSDEMFRPLYL